MATDNECILCNNAAAKTSELCSSCDKLDRYLVYLITNQVGNIQQYLEQKLEAARVFKGLKDGRDSKGKCASSV